MINPDRQSSSLTKCNLDRLRRRILIEVWFQLDLLSHPFQQDLTQVFSWESRFHSIAQEVHCVHVSFCMEFNFLIDQFRWIPYSLFLLIVCLITAVCIICWKDKPDSIKFFVSLTTTVIALKAGWLKELSLQLMEGNADQDHPLVITHFNLLVAMSNDALNHQHGCKKIITMNNAIWDKGEQHCIWYTTLIIPKNHIRCQGYVLILYQSYWFCSDRLKTGNADDRAGLGAEILSRTSDLDPMWEVVYKQIHGVTTLILMSIVWAFASMGVVQLSLLPPVPRR